MDKELISISKEISYALRHNPWLYGLEMDADGYVSIEQLIRGINENGEQDREISMNDIQVIMERTDKKRWETCGDRIRALYGHTISVEKMLGTPPAILYHGTSHQSIPAIMEQGLLPMARRYVHLSVDIKTATRVGRRKDPNPVILLVHALDALRDGVRFYVGNDAVWLSDTIPARHLSIVKND